MPETTVRPLRPMGIGEILDAGFRLVRERFATLALCAAAVAVPLTIVETLILAATDDAAFERAAGVAPSALSGAALAGWVAASLIGVLIVLLVLAACLRALEAAYLERRAATPRDALRFALRRLPALAGVYVLVAVSLIVGFMLLILPGIYLSVALAMALPALLFERLGPGAAYGRSLALVQGHWWRTLGTLLVAALIIAGLALVVSSVLGALLGGSSADSTVLAAIRMTVVDIVLSILLYPLAGAILTVLYHDLRVRHDGARAQDAQPDPPGFGPSGRWTPPRYDDR